MNFSNEKITSHEKKKKYDHKKEMVSKQDLLQYDAAAASRGSCPEDLDPGAPARGGLCDRGGAVSHELSVLLLNDLGMESRREEVCLSVWV